MAILHVLVGSKGEVLGTWQPSESPGKDAPQRVMLVAGPGQQVVQVKIDDKLMRLDPDALHKTLTKDHLKKARSKK
jgi:hypothetical protein